MHKKWNLTSFALMALHLCMALIFVLFSGSIASAATKYWIGAGAGNFNDNTRWSTISGGANNTTAPGSADLATFNNLGLGSCTITADPNVGGINIVAGYTGTITQNTGIALTIGAQHYAQAAGTFTGGNSAISVAGNWSLTGGTFTSTSGTMSLTGNYTRSAGTFTHNSGTVAFTGTSGTILITPGGQSFYNITFNDAAGTATYQLQGALTVANDLTVTDGILDTKSGSNYAINVTRDFTQPGTGGRVLAQSSTITVGRDITLNGTELSTSWNAASLVLTGTGGVTYNNLTNNYANGFYNLTAGQSGNTTTLNNTMSVINLVTVGTGTLTGNIQLYLYRSGAAPNGLSPFAFDAASTVSVASLKFFGTTPAVQALPTLNNGYSSNIVLAYWTIVTQSGAVTINPGYNLVLNGDFTTNRDNTYNTNGYALNVGGTIQVGTGGDTAPRTFNGTNSAITVGGNFDVVPKGAGSTQAVFTSTGSTVILNGSALQTARLTGSSFNNLTITNASAAGVSFLDAFNAANITDTTTGSKLTFKNGATYGISGTLTLTGTSGNKITLLSDSAGARFTLNPTGAAQTVTYVNVKDSQSSTNNITAYGATNSGGNDDAEAAPHWILDSCPSVTSTADSGVNTLRSCLTYANSNPGTTISFNIATAANQSSGGDSWWRISPATSLPIITANGTIIDGTTQTTNQGNTNTLGPEIELRGVVAGNGIDTSASNTTIKGLIINNFSGNGINVAASSVTVTGCYIGTDYAAAAAVANGYGIQLIGNTGAVLGTSAAADRNIISGNTWYGIASGASMVVKNNYIGTDRTGTVAIPNGNFGIYTAYGSNTIGGSGANEGNLISGNGTTGLSFAMVGSTSNVVKGNRIGTTADGTAPLPNGRYGIYLWSDTSSNTIGGTAAGEGNIIGFNGSSGTYAGVRIEGANADNNIISGNSIFGNTGLGIDLDGAGANNNKSAPTITSITPSGANFTVVATVTASDTIEFFRANNSAAPAVSADGSGSGEGFLYLGSCVDNGACTGPHINAVADANAAAGTVQATLLSSGLSGGDTVTATATDAVNGTSEFAANVTIVVVSGTVYTDEGVTNIGAGKTVRVLVNGLDRGSAATAAGGTYSITSTYVAGDALLVYIDGDATYKGCTVTAPPAANLSGVDIYAAHIITRHDNAGTLSNASMGTAKGTYVDTDIEYSVSGGNLTVSGTSTELFTPSGHGFTPGGNVTTVHMDIRGTVNGGANTLTVTGNWDASSGTYAAGTSTVQFTGNSATLTPGASSFYKLTMQKAVWQTLTVSGTAIVTNDLTLNGANSGAYVLGGTIEARGNIVVGANHGGGTTLVKINGSGAQSITSSGGWLPNIEVSSTGTLTLLGTIDAGGNWTHTAGTVDAGTSTLRFVGADSNFTPGNVAYYNVTLSKNSWGDLTVTGTATVTNDLALNGQGSTTLASGTIEVQGNVSLNASFGTATGVGGGLVKLVGTGNPSLSSAGGYLPHMEVAKSGGTLALLGTLDLIGNWTHTSGAVDAGTSTLRFIGGDTSFTPGNVAYYNITDSKGEWGDLTVIGTVTVTNDLFLDSSTSSQLNGGVIQVGRHLTVGVSNGNVSGAGSTAITLNGAGAQTITINGGRLPSGTFIINKSSGTATLATSLTLYGAGQDLTVTAGTFDLAGYNLTIPGDFSQSNGTVNATTSTIICGGNWSVTGGAFNAGSSTVVLNGTGQSITGNTTFNNFTKNVAAADTLTFAAGSTTTINGTATMNGASGQLLSLRSSSSPTKWNLNLGASSTKAISYVDVKDSDASGSDASKKPVNPANSVDSGNTIVWFAFLADALIKLSSEGDGAYLSDNVYEAAATTQLKNQGVVSGTAAQYNVRFQNDSASADSIVITGSATGSNFTVQYLDDSATDRTAAVTGAGYTIAGLAAGANKVWTLKVTPNGGGTPVAGGTSYNVFVTATSSGDVTKKDQVKAVTSSTSANITLLKSADRGTAKPGDEIAYTTTGTNAAGLTSASAIVMRDPIPANTGFKIGGASFNAGTSTLACAYSFSNNSGTSWAYTPVSGGCSAPAGYDYCVTDVRWTMTGSMPTNTSFSVGMVARVK